MPIAGLLSRNDELITRFLRLGSPGAKVFRATTNTGETVVMLAYGNGTSLTTSPTLMSIHSHAALQASFSEAYLRLGPDSIVNEDGHTAAAVWEPEYDTLRTYRAKVGVPPMFYWHDGDSLAWSTTIALLLELGAPKVIDPIALGHYQLTGYIQAPRTMLASVSKLPAAHCLEWANGNTVTRRYWHPNWTPKSQRTVERQAEEIEELLTASLEQSTPPSGRLGLLLSSGIDSVCLAAIASRRTDARVEAFTFEYPDYDGLYNEGNQARRVANELGIPHLIISITAEDIMNDLPKLVRQYEEPMSYGIHSAKLRPLAERGLDTVMSGTLAAAWTLSKSIGLATRLHQLIPGPIVRGTHKLAGRLPSWANRIRAGLKWVEMSDIQRYLSMSQQVVIPLSQARSLWNDRQTVERAAVDIVASLQTLVSPDLGARDQLAEMGMFAFGAEHGMWWTHRWAEAAAMSVRFPYRDDAYTDYMAQLANRLPDHPERRAIAAKYLPEEVAFTPKVAQSLPIDIWLRGPLSQFAKEQLSRDEIVADGTFVYEEVKRRLDEHISGQANHKWSIWTILAYLVWKREFLRA